eukprot:COSAG01_NODE_18274_length_1087_cov_1.560729_2_plen_58_part_01
MCVRACACACACAAGTAKVDPTYLEGVGGVSPEAQLRAVAAARRWCVPGALATVLDYD